MARVLLLSDHLGRLRCIAFYWGNAENGFYFSILDASLVNLTLMLQSLVDLLLHSGLRAISRVEDKLLEIMSLH